MNTKIFIFKNKFFANYGTQPNILDQKNRDDI